MSDTEKIRAAVFARTPDGRTLYAREATIEVTGEDTFEVTAPDSQDFADTTAARPIDLLRGVLHSARWAVDLTKKGQADEAAEHVDALERLIAAYRAAGSEATAPPKTDWIVEYKTDGSWTHLGIYPKEQADFMVSDLAARVMETRLIRATTTYTVEPTPKEDPTA